MPLHPSFALTTLLPILMLSSCTSQDGRRPAKPAFGPQVAGALLHPTRVEAFRVEPDRGPATGGRPTDPAGGGQRIGSARVTSAGKVLDPGLASRFAAALMDDANYEHDMAKGCIFVPGVALRFWKDKTSVDVVLCYHCNELKVFVNDGSGNPAVPEHRDFEPAAATFVRLAREAFPDDKEIQALGAK